MTCQACQTWNSDDEHRCRKCGRRLRTTPSRYVRDSYPIAASALAYCSDSEADSDYVMESERVPELVYQSAGTTYTDSRVIPFDQLTSPEERESIHARVAQMARPVPVRTETVSRRSRPASHDGDAPHRFDFFGKPDVIPAPDSSIHCGIPVAETLQRLNATLLDGLIIALGCVAFLAVFRIAVGTLPTDKLALTLYAVGLLAVAVAYKLVWCVANVDSFGIRAVRLRTVDLDGNIPTRKRRFWRAAGSLLSLGAAGLGLIWTFVDADGLAWHDQISGTFPTADD